jgi:hypothetical protein
VPELRSTNLRGTRGLAPQGNGDKRLPGRNAGGAEAVMVMNEKIPLTFTLEHLLQKHGVFLESKILDNVSGELLKGHGFTAFRDGYMRGFGHGSLVGLVLGLFASVVGVVLFVWL